MGIEVSTYPTLKIKQAIVGYGKADKSQVKEMVKTFLSLQNKPKSDDIADALGVAICYLQSVNWENKIKKTK